MNTDAPVTTILFLAANPRATSARRLDQELRDIEEGLRRSRYRDQFVLEQRWATRPRDMQRALLDVNPRIVHFSGHGEGEPGLVLEDDIGKPQFVSTAALTGLFGLFADQVECVLLNACYSVAQAEAIAQHIPYVIGMSHAIGDRAALEFAVGFYDALGAGRGIEFAYKSGCSAIQMAGIQENLTPQLTVNPNRKLSPISVSGALSAKLDMPAQLIKQSSPPSTLTARQRQRIEQELDSLQQQLNLSNQRLDRLRQAFTIETDPAVGLKLEKQVEQAEAERNRVQQHMEELEHKLST